MSYAGAEPVPVEPDPYTYNISPERIEAAITACTRAIIAVHLYGQPANMDPILEVAHRHDLRVIEVPLSRMAHDTRVGELARG